MFKGTTAVGNQFFCIITVSETCLVCVFFQIGIFSVYLCARVWFCFPQIQMHQYYFCNTVCLRILLNFYCCYSTRNTDSIFTQKYITLEPNQAFLVRINMQNWKLQHGLFRGLKMPVLISCLWTAIAKYLESCQQCVNGFAIHFRQQIYIAIHQQDHQQNLNSFF